MLSPAERKTVSRFAMRPQRLALFGIGIALAGALQATENLIPPLLPWFRLGFSNIITIFFLCTFGPVAALVVTLGKYLVAMLLSGLTMGTVLGAAGGLASWAAMSLLWLLARRWLGLLSISVAGALSHMTAQFAVLAAWLDLLPLWRQLPLALLWAYGAGIIIALLAWVVLTRFPEKLRK